MDMITVLDDDKLSQLQPCGVPFVVTDKEDNVHIVRVNIEKEREETKAGGKKKYIYSQIMGVVLTQELAIEFAALIRNKRMF